MKFEIMKDQDEMSRFIDDTIESINEAMRPEITRWGQLSVEELDAFSYMEWVDLFDFEKVYRDGNISIEQIDIIRKFCEWNESLGGCDETDC